MKDINSRKRKKKRRIKIKRKEDKIYYVFQEKDFIKNTNYKTIFIVFLVFIFQYLVQYLLKKRFHYYKTIHNMKMKTKRRKTEEAKEDNKTRYEEKKNSR